MQGIQGLVSLETGLVSHCKLYSAVGLCESWMEQDTTHVAGAVGELGVNKETAEQY